MLDFGKLLHASVLFSLLTGDKALKSDFDLVGYNENVFVSPFKPDEASVIFANPSIFFDILIDSGKITKFVNRSDPCVRFIFGTEAVLV